MSLHIPPNITQYKNLIVLIEGLFIDYDVTWRFLRLCVDCLSPLEKRIRFSGNNRDEIEYLGIVYTNQGKDVKELLPIFEVMYEPTILNCLRWYLTHSSIKHVGSKYDYVKLVFESLEIDVKAHKLKLISILYNSLLAEQYKVTTINIPIECEIGLATRIAALIDETDNRYIMGINDDSDLLKFADIMNFLGITAASSAPKMI